MLKRKDYVIIGIICCFLGIFLISQFLSGRQYKKIIRPENNEVMAVEISKLTKSNADLRREVQDLTSDLNIYRNSSETRRSAYDKYQIDSNRLSAINGQKSITGQGVILNIKGKLTTVQIVDLVNAIKNIGSETISINGVRLVVNSNLDQFSGPDNFEIKVLGNSKLFKSAIERRGGIINQIASKDNQIAVSESDNLTIESGQPIIFNYAKIIKEE